MCAWCGAGVTSNCTAVFRVMLRVMTQRSAAFDGALIHGVPSGRHHREHVRHADCLCCRRAGCTTYMPWLWF